MKRNISRYLYLLTFTAWTVLGQNAAGVGSITGVVEDATGAVVPNASVVVANPSKGIRRDLTTNAAGIFTAPALVPAAGYEVTVSLQGFQTYQVHNIDLHVGETVTLAPRLAIGTATTQVEVTAEAPVVSSDKTDVSQVVDTRQILDLPINGRRVDSFILLTPGVVADASFGLMSFRGNPGGNSFLTDGIDTTNQFYDENAGRTRTYNISQDAVQEFQVVSANFLAEYGNASGGVINTVTRSGTNGLHGTAYWFFRNRTLNATDPTAAGLNPPEWRHQAGASIGGPIKKDKLFYFFNGELQRRNFPIVSSNISNTNLFNAQGQYVATGANACQAPATAAQCQTAIAYIQGRVQPQLVPRQSDVNLMFGKVDYQMSDRNRLSAELNYLDFRSPNGIQTQASLNTGNAIGNNANTNVFDRTGKLGLTTVISPNMVNEARFGFFKDRQFDPASPSLEAPFGPTQVSVGSPAINYLGTATSYPRLLPSELRLQGSDTLSYTVGRHSIKFGVDYSHVEDYIVSIPNLYGTYTYTSLTSFAQDFSGNTAGAKDWTRYSQTFGTPTIDLNFNEIQFFLQDEFHITPKLTITPGARYEYTTLPQPTQVNPAFPQTGHIPDTTLNLAPRLGIAYSINDKTVFRGGYGIFYNRYVSAGIESLFLNNGLYQPAVTLNSNVAAQVTAGPVFPNYLAAQPNVAGTANLDIVDSNWRNSYSEQANIALERQLARNLSLTVSGVWSRSLHITSAYDANAANPTSSFTYQILDANGNPVSSYTTPVYTQRINPAYGKIVEMTSDANSYYDALIVQLQKRYSSWMQGQIAYTYSHTIDYDIGGAAGGPAGSSGVLYAPSFPTSVFNGNYSGEKGSSSNDERHRFVANAIFNPRFTHGSSWFAKNIVNGWQLSVIEVLGSSYPLPPTVSVSAFPSTAQVGGSGLLSTSTLNGLGGATRVPFESTSALNVGPIYRTDARLTKTLNITERFKTELIFEAFNVFNHTIPEGGTPRITEQYVTVNSTTDPKLGAGQIGLMPYSGYGTLSQTQAPPDGTTARRAQVAVRFIW